MNHASKISAVISSCILGLTFSSANASELLDVKPLFKDVVAGNPGYELVVPVVEEFIDFQDSAEYPTKYKVRFRVYSAGSTTKLFATDAEIFEVPDRPCADNENNFLDWDFDIDFVGTDNSHTGLIMTFFAECEEFEVGFSEAESSFLYVADTTQKDNKSNVWSKSWNKYLVGVNIVDWDDDQQDEVVANLVTETDDGESLRVMIFNKQDGALESKKDYDFLDISCGSGCF